MGYIKGTKTHVLISSSSRSKFIDGTATELTENDLAGVTNIRRYAFCNYDSLVSVTLPNSITNLGSSAFWDCANLTTVVIPSSIKTIDQSTFSDCANLVNVTIANGVETIGSSAFMGCTALTNITIPSTVTLIGLMAFNSCDKLTTMTILAEQPPTLEAPTFTIPDNVTTIYVPSGKLSVYQGDSNWSTFADKFVELEG